MALVVEDGTGLTTAEAYISVADADAYFVKYPNAAWTGTETAKENALRVAAQYIDTVYGPRFPGTRANETQALVWPMSGMYDFSDYLIEDDEIPVVISRANAEVAVEYLSGTALFSTVTDTGSLKKKFTKVGPIATLKEYHDGQGSQVYFTKVEAMLRPLMGGVSPVERG